MASRWIVLAALVLGPTVAVPAPAAAAPGNRSAATIAGEFADSCRDFTAHSSKDISHVEIAYADGRLVKDETTAGPDYAVDGGPGDDIESVDVKSGTVTDTFTCTRTSSPPTAVLEVKAPPNCRTLPDGLVDCDGRFARTAWTRSFVPSLGFGLVRFFCESIFSDASCVDHEMPCGEKDFYSLCRITYTYRATSSTDPENDIVSWSIDFGDGTSTGTQSWPPPAEIAHEYLIHYCPTCTRQPASLTVTDAAGQNTSDAQFVMHQYPD